MIFQNADSYRSHPNLESEIATRTISTELNAHADQYELTETITVPPEAAHTEIVESLPSSSSKAGKFLSKVTESTLSSLLYSEHRQNHL